MGYHHEKLLGPIFGNCILQELLAEVDDRPWKSLAKRRVQHYGYEFLYEVSDDMRRSCD